MVFGACVDVGGEVGGVFCGMGNCINVGIIVIVFLCVLFGVYIFVF